MIFDHPAGCARGFGSSAPQTAEVQERVQFDRVRGDAVLAVIEVEEGDTRYSCFGASPRRSAGLRHLALVDRFRSAVAIWGGSLRDHAKAALLEDEVVVAVSLLAHERDPRDHGEDVPLKGQSG